MNILAYVCETFVPVAVPFIGKELSSLKVKLLCFRTRVSSLTEHYAGYLTDRCSQTSLHAAISSTWGILCRVTIHPWKQESCFEGVDLWMSFCSSNQQCLLYGMANFRNEFLDESLQTWICPLSDADTIGLPGLFSLRILGNG